MKKTISILFALLFFALCLLPSLGMLVFGEASAGANEVLAVRPQWKNRDGSFNTELLGDFSDYIGDRFALRQECITAWATLNRDLLGTSVTEDVILGNNGWLYYAPTLEGYIGTDYMTQRELWCAARTLWLLQEYTHSQGGEFLFAIAPNKNSLYGENMPSVIPADSIPNRDILYGMLSDMGVNYADLYDAFAAETETLYFRTDSHWNGKGAALAADTLLAALGRESGYYTSEFTETEHKGDLYDMLCPAGRETETDFAYAPGFTFGYVGKMRDADSITLTTECAAGEGSLLMYRDSFGRNLYPYMAEKFENAVFSRKNNYDVAALPPNGTLVIELVERNLRYLNKYAPELPAAERDAPEAAVEITVSLKEEKCALDGYKKYTGALAAPPSARSMLFIEAAGRWYEAVPAPEGFTVCLPEGTDAAALRFYAVEAEDGRMPIPLAPLSREPLEISAPAASGTVAISEPIAIQ